MATSLYALKGAQIDAPARDAEVALKELWDDVNLLKAQANASKVAAALSEANAATSEANADLSEAAALDSEVTAAAHEAATAQSEANAAASEAAAALSEANVAAHYLDFRDKFLGSFSEAPTTDFEGNALTGGELYYDTTLELLRFRTTTTWATISTTSAEAMLNDLKQVDGTGSGLDADLLDGFEASHFSADGHTHDATDLLNWDQLNDPIITTSTKIKMGAGVPGNVSLTRNDGYGNGNVAFNHDAGVPDANGNAGRISVNVDATTDAVMEFSLMSGVTAGQAVATAKQMILFEDRLALFGRDALHKGNVKDLVWGDLD